MKNKIKHIFTKSKNKNFDYNFENLIIGTTQSGKTDQIYKKLSNSK